MEKLVVGVFSYLDDAIKAISFAKEKNIEFKVYSPVPNHELEHAIDASRSNVRVISLIGALTGITFGFALAILCSLDFPLRVSAKDIVSVPGFVVIGYECTILFGALATLTALFHWCRIPNPFKKAGYDPRFSADKFGVVLEVEDNLIDDVKSQLQNLGAEEVKVEDGI